MIIDLTESAWILDFLLNEASDAFKLFIHKQHIIKSKLNSKHHKIYAMFTLLFRSIFDNLFVGEFTSFMYSLPWKQSSMFIAQNDLLKS